MVKVKFKALNAMFKLPEQATPGSSGFDVRYAGEENILVMPHTAQALTVGCSVEVPVGYEIQVRSRSGLALREYISVANSPGTIDSDYRGECKVILYNFGRENYLVRPGDRIAQFVVAEVPQVELELVEDLSTTERGEGGFGSTGKN